MPRTLLGNLDPQPPRAAPSDTIPPWFAQRLAQVKARGFVDTLSKLVGAMPKFAQLPNEPPRQLAGSDTGTLAGRFFADARGNPVIGFTPHTLRNFAKVGVAGRPGYVPVDPNQSLLEYITGHEFGHMAATGVPNDRLASALLEIDPDAETSEGFADAFQNAAQFLRSHSTDTGRLGDTSREIVKILLRFAPYEEHPLNKR